MPESCSTLIDRLIVLRKEKGLSQRELAQATGLPQAAISRLERKKTIPQLDTLMKVALALGATLELIPLPQ